MLRVATRVRGLYSLINNQLNAGGARAHAKLQPHIYIATCVQQYMRSRWAHG